MWWVTRGNRGSRGTKDPSVLKAHVAHEAKRVSQGWENPVSQEKVEIGEILARLVQTSKKNADLLEVKVTRDRRVTPAPLDQKE